MGVEILVHANAPSTVDHDKQYRSIAQNVAAFQAVSEISLNDIESRDATPKYTEPSVRTTRFDREHQYLAGDYENQRGHPSPPDQISYRGSAYHGRPKRKREDLDLNSDPFSTYDYLGNSGNGQAQALRHATASKPAIVTTSPIVRYSFGDSSTGYARLSSAVPKNDRPVSAPAAVPVSVLVPYTGEHVRRRSFSRSRSSSHGRILASDSQSLSSPLLRTSLRPFNLTDLSLAPKDGHATMAEPPKTASKNVQHDNNGITVDQSLHGANFKQVITKSGDRNDDIHPMQSAILPASTRFDANQTTQALSFKIDAPLDSPCENEATPYLTAKLEEYSRRMPIDKQFLPAKVLRETFAWERGYWTLPIEITEPGAPASRGRLACTAVHKTTRASYPRSAWTLKEFKSFYIRVRDSIRANDLGPVSLYIDDGKIPTKLLAASGMQLTFRIYCWGQFLAPLYVAMCHLSNGAVERIAAEWVGSDGMAVVIMECVD